MEDNEAQDDPALLAHSLLSCAICGKPNVASNTIHLLLDQPAIADVLMALAMLGLTWATLRGHPSLRT